MTRTDVERFMTSLVIQPNGCLIRSRSTSYGRIRLNGKQMTTHRFAWILANGPIPDGLWVLHHCDNPPCCQTAPTDSYPEGHLFLGTAQDNADDMDMKGRRRHGYRPPKAYCVNGHLLDEANTRIDHRGWRSCRACRRDWDKARYDSKGRHQHYLDALVAQHRVMEVP